MKGRTYCGGASGSLPGVFLRIVSSFRAVLSLHRRHGRRSTPFLCPALHRRRTMGDSANDEKNRLPAEVIYQTLLDNLNRELDSFWQRSLFLWSFLVLAYTGYGALIVKTLDNSALWHEWRFNFIGSCVAAGGLFLSFLWILMARASKAWYEVNEAVIEDFGARYLSNQLDNGQEYELFSSTANQTEKRNTVEKEREQKIDAETTLWSSRLVAYVGFNFWKSKTVRLRMRERGGLHIFQKSGNSSPAKINVLLGMTSLIIWCVLLGVHLSFISCTWPCAVLKVSLLVLFLSLIVPGLVRSRILSKTNEKD